jgi:hypothetical protein
VSEKKEVQSIVCKNKPQKMKWEQGHIKLDLRNTNLVVKWDSLYHEMHAKKIKEY